MEDYSKEQLEVIYREMMGTKHVLNEMGTSHEVLDDLEGKLIEIKNLINQKTVATHITRTDSMFS
jgi:hypothetical protein